MTGYLTQDGQLPMKEDVVALQIPNEEVKCVFKESFYHAFVAGMFAGANYPVESNYEYGDGRSDIVVNDGDNDRVMLFEVKHADKAEDLEKAFQKALDQIKEKRYLEGIDEFGTVVSYGIAFYGKRCIIQLYPECKRNG